MKNITVTFSVIFSLALSSAQAASPLESLLDRIRLENRLDYQQNKERESEFVSKRDQQQKLLNQAKAELNQLNQVSLQLSKDFDRNEKKLTEVEAELKLAMGTLGEMFGVVKQVAGDLKGQLQASVVSAEIPGRLGFLDSLTQKKQLPDVEKLQQLWFELQREMTASGKVSRFDASVILPDGRKTQKKITRVGSFNLVADGKYLDYQAETGKLTELARQPEGRFTRLIDEIESSQSASVPFALDPSRGSILSMLIQAPGFFERVDQGGWVGYIILLTLLAGIALTVERFRFLRLESKKVRSQMTSREIDQANCLGRLLSAYEEVKEQGVEAIELKLEESILKSTPSLTRGLPTLKLMAAVAPLLGLLGTVTGMIATFQSITLFGTGDPRMMAGGISTALVTTVMGLICAIPLLLLHNFLSSKSKELVQVLEEQGAGLVARRAENAGQAL